MTAGEIVVVNWRDALPGTGEPGKQRPAVVVGRDDLYHLTFGSLLVVPLTSDAALRIAEASVEIEPTQENRCVKRCYALTWNVQTVPKQRIRPTQARVTDDQLKLLRDQIARLVNR